MEMSFVSESVKNEIMNKAEREEKVVGEFGGWGSAVWHTLHIDLIRTRTCYEETLVN